MIETISNIILEHSISSFYLFSRNVHAAHINRKVREAKCNI